MDDLRNLPSVDKLLTDASTLIDQFGRSLTGDAIRSVLDQVRSEIRSGQAAPDQAELLDRSRRLLITWIARRPRSVINATGVILHTNLGRAPLSAEAIGAMSTVASGYSDLEYDLDKGERGSRQAAIEEILKRETGAEAALVVNNNAGAMLLALSALARDKGALISRGQLIEIGGGFRVPDVMVQSGAKIIEVGTTNRTHRRDYEIALVTGEVGAIVRAHSSNFRTIGFTTDVPLTDLVELANWKNIPLIDDLGSGALIDTAQFGLAHEPTVQESIAAGVHVICFSGDKLLGGPQAGIIVGQAKYIDQLNNHPLSRALRIDKLDLAALSATLVHYLKEEAVEKIPVWHMIAMPISDIESRSNDLAASLRSSGFIVGVIDGRSTVGGGSLPGETLPTKLVALTVDSPNTFLEKLRHADPPVIARIEDDRVVIDLRTVDDATGLLKACLTLA